MIRKVCILAYYRAQEHRNLPTRTIPVLWIYEMVQTSGGLVGMADGLTGGAGGLEEVELCVTAGERSEPAVRTPLTLSRPQRGRTTEDTPAPPHHNPPQCGATPSGPIKEVPAIRRFASLTRGYAWCRPFGAQIWRELAMQVRRKYKSTPNVRQMADAAGRVPTQCKFWRAGRAASKRSDYT